MFKISKVTLMFTMEFFLNGGELSFNLVILLNSGNLINHWSMNTGQFKDPDSHMCLASTVVASWKLWEGNVFTGVCDSVHRGVPGRGLVPGPGEGCLVWSWGGVPGPGDIRGGFAWSQGVPGGDPSWTAIAVGGTHPTGMHSCDKYFLSLN